MGVQNAPSNSLKSPSIFMLAGARVARPRTPGLRSSQSASAVNATKDSDNANAEKRNMEPPSLENGASTAFDDGAERGWRQASEVAPVFLQSVEVGQASWVRAALKPRHPCAGEACAVAGQ